MWRLRQSWPSQLFTRFTFIVYGPRNTLFFPCKPDGLYVCDREVEAAKRVVELKRNAGYPSDADLSLALQRGDFAHTNLKGKTKRGRPTTTDVEYVDTAFFVSLSTPLGLIIATLLRTRTQRDVWNAQFQQLSIYKSEGFQVHKIFFDREGAIGALEQKISDAGYRPQQSGAGSHVPYSLPHQLIEWLLYSTTAAWTKD